MIPFPLRVHKNLKKNCWYIVCGGLLGKCNLCGDRLVYLYVMLKTHLKKASYKNIGATAPAFNSQDAEGLTKHNLMFTLASLRLCQRPFHNAGTDTEMQKTLIYTYVFIIKDIFEERIDLKIRYDGSVSLKVI